MSIPPTRRMLDMLRFIRGFQLARGYSPSVAECAAGIGSSARSTAHACLVELERRGQIRRLRQRERSIDILEAVPVPQAPDGAPLFVVPMTSDGRRYSAARPGGAAGGGA